MKMLLTCILYCSEQFGSTVCCFLSWISCFFSSSFFSFSLEVQGRSLTSRKLQSVKLRKVERPKLQENVKCANVTNLNSWVGPSTPFYTDVCLLDGLCSTLCKICQHSTTFKEQIAKNKHSVLTPTPFLKGVVQKQHVRLYQNSSILQIHVRH